MSFILDALRRAENERKAGAIPDLDAVTQIPAAPPHRRYWPWVTAIFCATAVCLICIPLFYRPETSAVKSPSSPELQAEPTIPQPPSAKTASASPQTNHVNPSQVENEARPIPLPSAAPREIRQEAGTTDSTVVSAIPLPTEKTATDPTPATAGPFQQRTENNPREVPPLNPAPGKEPVSETERAQVTPTDEPNGSAGALPDAEARPDEKPPKDLVAKDTPPGETEPAQSPTTRVSSPTQAPLSVNELPEPLRQTFSGISLDAHVYSETVRERFVLIGMRGHRIGDVIDESSGVVLEDITPEGAVLRAKDTLVFLPHP